MRLEATGSLGNEREPIRVLHADSTHDCAVVRNALEHAPHSYLLTEASSRAELERRLASGAFDIILCDLNIPEYEGFDILAAIASHAPDTPVVIVTGTGTQMTPAEALRRGATDCVLKTAGYERLLPFTLEAVLARARGRRAQEQSAEELRRAKAQIESVVEKNRDGMLGVNSDGVVRFANAAVAQITGRAPDTLISLRDISERKSIEQQLRESEERYRLALRSTSLVVAMIDKELRYEWIHNPHPDFESTSVVGKRDDELVSGPDIDRFVEFKRSVLHLGIEQRAELSFSRSDGVHTYDVIAQPVRSPAGEIVGLTTTSLDISHARRSAARIEHLNRVLSAIRNINRLTVRERDPDKLIQQACRMLTDSRGYSGVWIAFGDATATSFAYSGWTEREIRAFELRARRGEWPTCRSRLDGHKRCVVTSEPATVCPGCPLASRVEGHRAVATALRVGDAMSGMLCVTFPPELEINDDETTLLVEVAGDIAFALEDIEKERRQVSAVAEAAALLRASKAVLESDNFETASRRIFEICKEQTGATAGYVALRQGDDANGVLFLDPGEGGCTVDPLLPMPIRGLRAIAYRERRTVFENQFPSSPHTACLPPGHAPLRNVMFVPIILDDDVKGVIGLANKDGDFEEEDARRAQSLGEIAAIALERRQYIEAMNATKEKLEKAQQVAHIGHWELDAYDGTPAWSDELFRIFGLDPGAAAPSFTRHDTIIDPRDWPRLAQAVREGFEDGKPFDLVLRILRPGRSPGWLHAIGAARRNGRGRVVGLFGTAQDVSEREHARLAVAASEERFRLAFDHAAEGVLLTDAATRRLLQGNKACCDLLGYSPEELATLTVADIHPPEALPEVDVAFARQAAGEHSFGEAVTMKRKDGSLVQVDIAGASIVHEGRRVMLATLRDVTETLRLRASLAQSDRLASMGTLAAGVAHEINNPLTYVLYNLGSLAEDIPRYAAQIARARGALVARLGEDALRELLGSDLEVLDAVAFSDVHARFRDALGGARRIMAIARGLGTFSRVEKDTMAPVDLRHPIESALSIAFNEIKYRAHVVKDYCTSSTVMASEGRIAQVFLNLLVNAAHAIGDGDVEHNKITIRTWQDGNEILAEVQDTGCGIPPESLSRIFDPFFTTKPAGIGTGLGLSIVKDIIAGYGGQIAATSEVGKGTRFLIRLPVARSEGASIAVVTARTQWDGVRGRILVIDDEAGIREALKRILRQHEIVEAESGEQGQALLAKDQRFDVILCDMMMPRVSGVDVHKWLLEYYPQLARKVVFVTGGAFMPGAREYLERVSNLRVDKPFEATNLQKMVAEWVRASNAPESTQPCESSDLPPKVREVLGRGEPVTTIAAAAGAMVPEMLGRLTQAAIAARHDEICSILAELRPSAPQLATALQALADRFDYAGIRVQTRVGQGATIDTFLPQDTSPMPPKTALPHASPPRASGEETVLLVEDESALREAVRRSLQGDGYTVLAAPDGAEALRVAGDHAGAIHLLLTDMLMPNMGGRALAEELRKARPGVKVLYMSGYTHEASAGLDPGDPGGEFIGKPFSAADLAEKVRAVLDSPAVAFAAKHGSEKASEGTDGALLAGVPGELLARLRQAVEAARHDDIVALLATLRGSHPKLASRLVALAEALDYTGLRGLLCR